MQSLACNERVIQSLADPFETPVFAVVCGWPVGFGGVFRRHRRIEPCRASSSDDPAMSSPGGTQIGRAQLHAPGIALAPEP